jgi:hypothetical protein
MMNVDAIFTTMNEWRVNCMLIGGMNFLLNHEPVLTYDVDLWIEDKPDNLARLNKALHGVGAEWGPTRKEWKPVPPTPDWLTQQSIFCLTSRMGAIDIYRKLPGLETKYPDCHLRSTLRRTPTGVAYRSLSDQDMLASQLALPPDLQKPNRIDCLRRSLEKAKEVKPTRVHGISRPKSP